MTAADYAGWVILFDEVELIGCYGLLQRAKSYAEIARFSGRLPQTMPGILAVFAVTDDFVSAILYGKRDLTAIPAMGHVGYQDGIPSAHAVAGMDAIRQKATALRQPTQEQLLHTLERVTKLYVNAYGWQPPATTPEATLLSTRMRQHLKGWIYRWDLARMCGVSDTIEAAELATNYAETPEGQGVSVEDDLISDLAEILTSSTINATNER